MIRRLSFVLLLCIVLMGVANPCHGANVTVSAGDVELWNGTAFVIVARIVDVARREGEPIQSQQATIEPICCVAGLFNPAEHPKLKLNFSAAAGDPIWLHPKANDLVLAVVYDDAKLGIPKGGFGLANGRCFFMPKNHPLVVLKDMTDPSILEVLRKMQGARPATAPATQPAEKR